MKHECEKMKSRKLNCALVTLPAGSTVYEHLDADVCGSTELITPNKIITIKHTKAG